MWHVQGGTVETHVLKLLKNPHGEKHAGEAWGDYLAEKLIETDLQWSNVDECVWYKEEMVLFVMWIMEFGFQWKTATDTWIRVLQNKGLKNEDQGHPSDYKGVNIAKIDGDQYIFNQSSYWCDCQWCRCWLKTEEANPNDAHKLLHHHLDSLTHNPHHFNYRSVVGKLHYMAQISQPDICYAVCQCEKYSATLMQYMHIFY